MGSKVLGWEDFLLVEIVIKFVLSFSSTDFCEAGHSMRNVIKNKVMKQFTYVQPCANVIVNTTLIRQFNKLIYHNTICHMHGVYSKCAYGHLT